MYIRSHEGSGQSALLSARGLGHFLGKADPPFGKMDFGQREIEAKNFARQQQQKYETVAVHNIVTGPQSTWTVGYRHLLPAPGIIDRMMLDNPEDAQRRKRQLLAYGLKTGDPFPQQIQGQLKYRVKATGYFGRQSGPSLPIKLGLDVGFQWDNPRNAQRRAEGLHMLGYGAKVEQRRAHAQGPQFFQLNITGLPKLPVTITKRSRWHRFIQDAVRCPPVDVLIDGKAIFAEMSKAIRSATPQGITFTCWAGCCE